MAFLDKMKEVADKGFDKAKDLSEVASAKAKIAVAEAKIKDVYTEVGKLVVEAGGVIPEAGLAEQLEKYNGLQAEIAAIKATLEAAPADAQ